MAMSELLTRVLIGIAREFMAHGAAHDRYKLRSSCVWLPSRWSSK